MSDNEHSIRNLSLVAFYGDKPVELINLIHHLQEHLANHRLVKHKFVPYQLQQIHGTIIGCEGFKTELGIISKWFYEHRQETRSIDFSGLIDYLRHQADLPLSIRFGGFDRNTEYNFLSRDQHLYFRSWQLQPAADQTIPVLIGWSWKNESVSLAIDNLRRDLQQFNLLHKYHATPHAIDNDFYLRLGTIDRKLTSKEIAEIATDIRDLLETLPALYIPLNLENLVLVEYQDLSLTPATTRVIPVSENL
ncbi:MAG: hypothetical protein WBM44_29715 [Waterburya sp.]